MIASAVSAAVAATGLYVMATGARREAAGRLEEARRLGRLGGFVAVTGAVGLAVAATPFALLGGAIALLGGLSGKPRPAWWIAAAALAGALVIPCYTSGPP